MTSGQSPDPDGYAVLLDGASVGAVGANADTTLGPVIPGSHALTLDGVADNCRVDGGADRTAVVGSGATADEAFSVACDVPQGPPPPLPDCVGPQVTNAAQWAAAIAGQMGRPGETIWVRAGTYPGESTVQAANRTIRACPGERVTVGNLVVFGSGVTVWGFEVAGEQGNGKLGINIRAPGSRMINNVVHNAGLSGIGFWEEATDAEVAGNVVYDNGTTPNLDHGIYSNGRVGGKLIRDNIILHNKAYGIHLYAGGTSQFLSGIEVRGNIVAGQTDRADLIIGTTDNLAEGMLLDSNTTYRPDRATQTADLGWNAGPPKHRDLTLLNNYFVGTVDHLSKWQSLVVKDDTVITAGGPPPSVNRVLVRRNPYERGRANIAIYRWVSVPTVEVDLAGVLEDGQSYEVHRATDFYGPAVLAGTYSGPVAVPVTSEFDAFVVVGK